LETLILDSIKESSFLITGGAGFIGSNLCEFLLENKAKKVICLDNLINGKLENISTFLDNPNFTFIQGDILDFNLVLKLSKNIDFVLHQAAWGSVPRSMVQPLDYLSNNVLGTHNILEASRINKVKKVVYASSSSVYGNHPDLPKLEGREGNILSPYALSKKINEHYGKLYWEVYSLPTIGLRYFNVFGRRQNPNGDYAAVIPKFIQSIIQKKSPKIDGDGYQSRDFTYIDNVIQANILACFNTLHNDYYGQSLNIACGKSFSLIELIKIISYYLDSTVEIRFGPQRPGDISHSLANINRAFEAFGYEPIVNFEDGLIQTIEWYKKTNKF
jgi:UDP-N-acetylglucosamine 4-epimerase